MLSSKTFIGLLLGNGDAWEVSSIALGGFQCYGVSVSQLSISSPMQRQVHRPWDPRRALVRVGVSSVAGVATFLLSPNCIGWPKRVVVAWDIAAFLLCTIEWWIIWRAHAKATQSRAAAEDPGRMALSTLVLASCLFSLFASVYVLHRVGHDKNWTILTLLNVLLSWTLTHTVYTLRYAHLYYRGSHHGGLEFPGEHPPADIDFAYFAFTIGICFQTSDVAISSPAIRRTVLLHAVVSFLYNTTILALALNFVYGTFTR
jgi:uncharacterized membrane protein